MNARTIRREAFGTILVRNAVLIESVLNLNRNHPGLFQDSRFMTEEEVAYNNKLFERMWKDAGRLRKLGHRLQDADQ